MPAEEEEEGSGGGGGGGGESRDGAFHLVTCSEARAPPTCVETVEKWDKLAQCGHSINTHV